MRIWKCYSTTQQGNSNTKPNFKPRVGVKVVHKEINDLLEKEKLMWNQRSHATGLREDYKKIYKVFQSKATQRKQRNMIYGLLDAQRVWQESCEKVEEEVVKYFQEIYSSSYPQNLDPVLSKVHKTVTDKVNDLLAREYKEEEVAQPLLQMFPTNLLGLEGMPVHFFQNIWHKAGTDVTTLFLSSLIMDL